MSEPFEQPSLFSYKNPVNKEEHDFRPLAVSDLNQKIKSILETQFGSVLLQGEISNFKAHGSGHYYFSIKDDHSQINAVMFKGANSRLKFMPKNGMEVLIRGRVGVYAPRGSYQIYCDKMDPVGQGGLKEQFEKLKLKLKQEGLFNSESKKSLPYLPFQVALVTSPTGAAVRDMIRVLKRKHPAAQIRLVPALTQGEAAPKDLIRALTQAENIKGVEVILLARGGGSLEDLWCFNDEGLARKIFSMKVPVISGVGHEIDFTIADFVADLRAATPSAAAEIVCKNRGVVGEKIKQFENRLNFKIRSLLDSKNMKLYYMGKQLKHPKTKLQNQKFILNTLYKNLLRSMEINLGNKKKQIKHCKSLKEVSSFYFLQQAKNLDMLNSKLNILSPFKVLERGYAVVKSNQDKKVIRNPSEVHNKDELSICVLGGNFKAVVEK